MGYHDDVSELTKGQLNVFCNNPYEYQCQYILGTMPRQKESSDMIAGTILHAVLLEKKKVDDLVGVYPESCLKTDKTLNGKQAAKHRAANPGKYWMKEKERDQIVAVHKRLLDTPITEAIEAASMFEHQWHATLYGRKCKCRSDIAGDTGRQWDVWDLKFTPNIAMFVRNSRALRYWLQDSHYSPVISQNVGKPVNFKFLVAETLPPYRVRVYFYDEIKREMAAKYHKSKILSLMACESSGIWPDVYEGNLPLNEYDVGEAGDVLFDDEALDALNAPVEELNEAEMEMPF